MTDGKEPITEIGKTVPQNLKFAIIVSIALFWAEFLRSILVLALRGLSLPVAGIIGSFTLAVAATLIGLFILVSYRRLKYRLGKIRVRKI